MDDKLTDNTNLVMCKLCKTCIHRDKTVVRGKNVGYEKCFCDAYEMKPDAIMFDNEMSCKYYSEEK